MQVTNGRVMAFQSTRMVWSSFIVASGKAAAVKLVETLRLCRPLEAFPLAIEYKTSRLRHPYTAHGSQVHALLPCDHRFPRAPRALRSSTNTDLQDPPCDT